MKIGIFIQARTNSTRLPGKIYEKIDGKMILEHTLEACRIAVSEDHENELFVVILGPYGDEKLEAMCKKIGVNCVLKGEESNVLERYTYAMELFKCDAMIRITSDCWRVDPKIIMKCSELLNKAEYVSACLIRSFKEGIGDVQGATTKGLEWISHYAEDQEHVFGKFEANQMIRDAFVRDGLRFMPIFNPKNEIFIKTSIDTLEELNRAKAA